MILTGKQIPDIRMHEGNRSAILPSLGMTPYNT